jgi:hypothetical protein
MKLVIPLMIAALSGSAYAAAGDQTVPGASQGAKAVNPSAPGRNGSDSTDSTGGPTGIGGMPNSTSASGQGNTQGSGGMQPRLDKGGEPGSTTRKSSGGDTAQGH